MNKSMENEVVLITGANGGLGEQFVGQSIERGARKVYATARSRREWGDPRIVPLHLDVLDTLTVARAAEQAGDTTLVINNAGIVRRGPLIDANMADVRLLFETHFFGPLKVAQAFAEILKSNGGGGLMNVLSTLSWDHRSGAYSAAKAALWSATDSLRLELAPNGTTVSSLVLGWTRTPMTAAFDAPMNEPADVVRVALDGFGARDYEILADHESAQLKRRLSAPIESQYPELVWLRQKGRDLS